MGDKKINDQQNKEAEQRITADREALSVGESRFQSLVEMTSDWLWEVDGEAKYTYSNPVVFEILGYTAEEVIGRTPFDFMELEERERVRKVFAEIGKQGGMFKSLRNVNVHKNGNLVVLETSGVPLKDDNGKLIGFRGIDRDITLREKQEQLIWAKQQKVQTFFENSRDGWVVLDTKGIILECNQAYCNMLGYREDELKNKVSFWQLTPSKWHAWEDKEILGRLTQYGYSGIYEKEYVRKNGEVFPVEIQGYTMFDGNGPAKYMLGIVRDITENRKKEQILQENKRNLEYTYKRLILATEVAGIGIWEFDALKNKMHFDKKTCEFYGMNQEEFYGTFEDWQSFVHPDDLDDVCRVVRAALDGESELDMEFRIIRTEDEICYLKVYAHVFRDENGAPNKIIGVNYDLTERKIMENDLIKANLEAESANLAKSQFLATMSHEIRTPMNPIIGMTELLLMDEKDADKRELLEIIKESGEALLLIINDILDISKMETGMMSIEQAHFELNDVLRSIVSLFKMQATKKTLTFSSNIDRNLPDIVQGDPVRVKQIIANLLNNAIKFTNTGGVAIQVSVMEKENMHCRIRIEVRDTGVGIEEEQQKKLFKTFSQVDSSTTRKYGGTGLGLSIVAKLVEMMNGKLGCESVKMQGSTFWVEIPFKIVDNF